jgi:predicted ATPase/DNA-binding SARP family transcriptional activator
VDARWRIELFGGLRVRQGEQVIPRFRTQKNASLLAYLAYYADRKHPREALYEVVWPEVNPDAGRNNLRVALSSLRRQLEPPGVMAGTVIVADRASVGLNPIAVTTDVAEFEAAMKSAARADGDAERVQHLTAAVELHRGELLHGFLDEWIDAERRRLADAILNALRRLTRLLSQAKEFDRALDYARRAVSVDPLHEPTHRTLMRLYTALGRPAAALEQFRELERILREELDAAPSEATLELLREIENRTPGLGLRVKGSATAPQPPTAQLPNHLTTQLPVIHYPPLTTHSPSGYLPLHITRFFGREEEIAQLREMLRSPDVRLVTLTGMGGTGKTRLAIEVARQLQEECATGVWFVPLADLSDPSLVISAVLNVLHIPPSPDVEPIEQVVEVLSRQPSLLILDNVEHLIGKLGNWEIGKLRDEETQFPNFPFPQFPQSVVRTLLARVPTLTCLITSRQRLDIEGEREFSVPPLPAPSHSSSRISHPLSLMTFASVQLFVDRAQAVRPDFQVTARNAPAVAALCQCLEGIPLAIELAAARVQVLTPSQMLEFLERRFDFLVSRRRDVTERHRTLRAAIDWSDSLLSPELQWFWRRLSVFREGWTLEAAEAISDGKDSGLSAQDSTLDLLEQLRECSLITAEEAGGAMRYRMLETLRAYGWERLEESQELEEIRARHCSYFLLLAEAAETEQEKRLGQLEAENENLRAALQWAMESDGASALRLAGALGRFWEERGYWAEGRVALETVLRRNPDAPTALRAKALRWAGHLTFRLGDFPQAQRWLAESLHLSRAANDRREAADALNSLGGVAHAQGEYKRARVLCEESLMLHRELGDKSGVAWALHYLGNVARYQGDYEQAHACYEESLTIRRELGDKRGIAFSLESLGNVARFQGNYAKARAFCEEGLAIRRELGDKGGVAWLLENLGAAALAEGDDTQARFLCEGSLTLHREIGNKGGVAWALHRLGTVARHEGDCETARSLYEESLTLCRTLGDKRGIAFSLQGMANVARLEGDHEEARALCQESLVIWRDLSDKRGIAECLETLAHIASAQKQAERAAQLLGAAEALREAIGSPLPPAERSDYDRSVSAIRAALSKKDFATAWTQGRALTWEQAAALNP